MNEKVKFLDNSIEEEGAEHLATFLEGNQSLKHLELSNNMIQDKGVFHLLKSLQKHKGLQSLNLNSYFIIFNFLDNEITYRAGSYFKEFLEKNNVLKDLFLSSKRFQY